MKVSITIILWVITFASSAQYINVWIRPQGAAAYNNSFWNNFSLKGIATEISQPLQDIVQNPTGITAQLSSKSGENAFDNGPGYKAGTLYLPDTVIRGGVYFTDSAKLQLSGLNDSVAYTITFYASRNRTDGQKTVISSGTVTATIPTDTNTLRVAQFAGRSKGGMLSFTLKKGKDYLYLNAFTIMGLPKKNTVKAVIKADSLNISYPNTKIFVTSDSSIGCPCGEQWVQLSGPNTALFNQYTVHQSVISGLVPGTYRFMMRLTDSLLNTDSSTIAVTVAGLVCPVCPPPRTITGFTPYSANGILLFKPTYSDGNP